MVSGQLPVFTRRRYALYARDAGRMRDVHREHLPLRSPWQRGARRRRRVYIQPPSLRCAPAALRSSAASWCEHAAGRALGWHRSEQETACTAGHAACRAGRYEAGKLPAPKELVGDDARAGSHCHRGEKSCPKHQQGCPASTCNAARGTSAACNRIPSSLQPRWEENITSHLAKVVYCIYLAKVVCAPPLGPCASILVRETSSERDESRER